MNLPDLPLLFLTFRLQAREPVVLPPFLGSTLRGAFGKALKQFFCFVPHGDCEKCWFFEGCPYQFIFESPNLIPNEGNHPKLRGQKQLPQPFVLVPPPLRKKHNGSQNKNNGFNETFAANHFSGGETLDFSILLIGKATVFWSQILVAARLLAENGLGANRIPFSLTGATAHDRFGKPLEIYDANEKSVTGKSVSAVTLAAAAGWRAESLLREMNKTGAENLEIEFLTPARIRVANEVKAELDAFTFFKKITERIEFLSRIYNASSGQNDYRDFIGKIEKTLTLHGELKTYKYEQFSNRQNKKTIRDVITASLKLGGNDPANYLPILTAGEILHVGSNTSDGFGRFIVRIS